MLRLRVLSPFTFSYLPSRGLPSLSRGPWEATATPDSASKTARRVARLSVGESWERGRQGREVERAARGAGVSRRAPSFSGAPAHPLGGRGGSWRTRPAHPRGRATGHEGAGGRGRGQARRNECPLAFSFSSLTCTDTMRSPPSRATARLSCWDMMRVWRRRERGRVRVRVRQRKRQRVRRAVLRSAETSTSSLQFLPLSLLSSHARAPSVTPHSLHAHTQSQNEHLSLSHSSSLATPPAFPPTLTLFSPGASSTPYLLKSCRCRIKKASAQSYAKLEVNRHVL